jgi:hypothetical protein
LGAKIPSGSDGSSKNESSKEQPKRSFEEYQEEEEEQLPLPELDNSGVIEDKTCGEEYAMGDLNKEVSDEDMEKALEHRQAAQLAFFEGIIKDGSSKNESSKEQPKRSFHPI